MDVKYNKDIEDILLGKVSAKEAQEYLSRITSEDLKLISEEKFIQMLEMYKERNNHTLEPVSFVSKADKAEIWQNIITEDKTPAPSYNQLFGWLKEKLSDLSTWFPHSFLNKYGLAAAAMLILIIAPVIFQLSRQQGQDYFGLKGEDVQSQMSLQFAIAGPEGNLIRPDRPLTQKDTIAFRVKIKKGGFCSIYIINRNRIDKVATDRYLTGGSHDFSVGYTLKGNPGKNTLVLLLAEAPISIGEKEKQSLILESVRNMVSSFTIQNNTIYLKYRYIEVD